MDMSGGGTLQLEGTFSLTASASTFTPGSGTVIFDGASQIIPATTFANLTISQSSGTATLSAGTTTVNDTLTVSSGTVDAGAGTYDVTGTTLVDGGTLNFSSGVTITALDTLNLSSGTVGFTTGATVDVGTFNFSGGTLSGSDTVNVSGDVNWTGGTTSGTGTLQAESTLELGSSSGSWLEAETLDGWTLENYGTGQWLNGQVSQVDGSEFHNAAGATLSIVDTAGDWEQAPWNVDPLWGTWVGSFGTPSTGSFVNDGTVTENATATGPNVLNVSFNNESDGTVAVANGTLSLQGGISDSGQITVASGAEFGFDGTGTTDLASTSNTSGAGTVEFGSGTVDAGAGTYDVTGTTLVDGGTLNFSSGVTITALDTLNLSSGTVGFTTGATVDVGTFNFSGGTLSGSDTVNVSGDVNWTGGTTSGTGTLQAESTLELGSSSGSWLEAETLDGWTLENYGTGQWLNGQVSQVDGSEFHNAAGATLSIVDTAGDWEQAPWNVDPLWGTWVGSFGTPSTGSFVNDGTVTENATATGPNVLNVSFNNESDGTVAVANGTLSLQGGISDSGQITVASGAEFGFDGTGTTDLASTSNTSGAGTVEFGSGTVDAGAGTYDVTGTTLVDGGTLNFSSGVTITALDTLNLSSGTVGFTTGATVDVGTFNFSGGTLSGSDTVNVSGDVNWTGGTTSGTGTLQAESTLELGSSSGSWLEAETLDGWTLENYGTGQWLNGQVSQVDGSEFHNAAGATLSIVDTAGDWEQAPWNVDPLWGTWVGSFGTPSTGSFVNDGTVTENATATGPNVLNVSFNNESDGTVAVANGTLSLQGGISDSGQITVASGAEFGFDGTGTTDLASTSNTSGAGTVEFGSGTVDAGAGTYDVTGTTLVDGGTLNFSSGVTITALDTLNLSSGTVGFTTGATVDVGTFNFSGGTLSGSDTVNVSGDVNWTGGTTSGTGTLQAESTLELGSSSGSWLEAETLDGWTLENYGTGQWLNGQVSQVDGSEFHNAAGATLSIVDTAGDWEQAPWNVDPLWGTWVGSFGTPSTGSFVNDGTVTENATATGPNVLNVSFNNESDGTVAVANGTLSLQGGISDSGQITVASGAEFGFDGTGTTDLASTSNTSGAGTVEFGSGTVDAGAGTYDVTGTTLVDGGTLNFSSGVTITALDTLNLSSGTVGFTTGATVDVGTFNFSGGTLPGSDTVNVSGDVNWTGGTTSGTGTLQAESTLELGSSSGSWLEAETLDGWTLENYGTGQWLNGQVSQVDGSEFHNAAGATLSIVDTAGDWEQAPWNVDPLWGTWVGSFGTPSTGSFVNDGTVTENATATGPNVLNVSFNNESDGTVAVANGTLSLQGGISDSGQITVASGAEFGFDGTGTTDLASTSNTSGAGTVEFGSGTVDAGAGTYDVTGTTLVDGGTLNFSSGVTITALDTLNLSSGTVGFTTGATVDVGTFNFSGGTLSGSDTVNVSGDVNWTGGTTSGTGTLQAESTLELGSSSGSWLEAETLDGWTLENYGTGQWLNGQVSQVDGSEFHNAAGATLSIVDTAGDWEQAPWNVDPLWGTWVGSFGTPSTGSFVNDGTVTENATATGPNVLNVSFNNESDGTVSVANGTLDFWGAVTDSGTWTVVSSVIFEAGVTGSGDSLSVESDGEVEFAGGTSTLTNLTLSNSGLVSITSGTVSLCGSISEDGAITISSGAEFGFDGTGTTSLSDSNDISGAGTVEFGSGTVDAGAGSYDVTGTTLVDGGTLNFSSGITLDPIGTLSVSSGTIAFTTGDAVDVGTLFLSGGTLSGSDALNVSMAMTWTGGLMSGTGTTNVGSADDSSATLQLGSTSISSSYNYAMTLDGWTLNNYGVGTWVAEQVSQIDASEFHNESVGSLTISTATDWVAAPWTGSSWGTSSTGSFVNDGIVTENVSSGTTWLKVSFNNSSEGTVAVTNGTLSLRGAITESGGITVSSGAEFGFDGTGTTNLVSTSNISGDGTVEYGSGTIAAGAGTYDVAGTTLVDGGTLHFESGVTLDAIGTLDVSSGTVTFTTGTTVGIGEFIFSGGTQSGSDTLNISSSLIWTGGLMSGTGTTNVGSSTDTSAVLQLGATGISNSLALTMDGWTLNNYGTGTWQAEQISQIGGSEFHNESAGYLTFETTTDWAAAPWAGSSWGTASTGSFVNDGIVVESVSSGTTWLKLSFDNTSEGTVSVSSGTLSLRGAITEDGTVAVSSGAEFGFDGTGTTDLASTSVISGYGTVEYGSGTINAGAGTYDVPGTTLVDGGTLSFDSGITITAIGTLNLSSGTVDFTTGAAVGIGTFLFSGGTLSGSDTLDVSAALTWTGGAMSGTGTVQVGSTSDTSATAQIGTTDGDSSVVFTFGGWSLLAYGSTSWLSGEVAQGSGSAVNEPTGSFSIESGNSWNSDSTGTFTNDGAITSVAGTGTANFGLPFTNASTGSVSVPSAVVSGTATGSTLQFSGTMTDSGNWSVGSGTSGTDVSILEFSGGGTSDGASFSVASDGQVVFAGSTFTVSNVTLPVTWAGGLSVTAGTVDIDADLTVGSYVQSGGTMNLGADLEVTGGGTSSAGSFNVAADCSLVGDGGTLALLVTSFSNSGSVEADSGTLQLGGTGTDAGSFSVSSGATLGFDAGTATLTSESEISGAGTAEFGGGTVYLAGTYNVTGTTTVDGGTVDFQADADVSTIPTLAISAGTASFTTGDTITVGTLELSGGTLGGSDQIQMTGQVYWTGGTMSGTTTLLQSTYSWTSDPTPAPTITTPSDQTNNEGDTVSLSVSASNPSSYGLTYAAINLPAA